MNMNITEMFETVVIKNMLYLIILNIIILHVYIHVYIYTLYIDVVDMQIKYIFFLCLKKIYIQTCVHNSSPNLQVKIPFCAPKTGLSNTLVFKLWLPASVTNSFFISEKNVHFNLCTYPFSRFSVILSEYHFYL